MRSIKNSYWIIICLILADSGCRRNLSGFGISYEIADFSDSEIAGEVIDTGKVLYRLENNIDYIVNINKNTINLHVKNKSSNKILCFGSNWQEITIDSLTGFISSPDIDLEEAMNIILILPDKEIKYSFKIPDSAMVVSILNYFLTSIPKDVKMDSLRSKDKMRISIPFNEYPKKNIDYISIDINLKTLRPDNPLIIESN